MKKTYRGYSLFELLIAIVVLSLLVITSYLVIPKLIQKAYDARRKVDLDKIKKNLEIYYSFANEFPRELPTCNQPLLYNNQTIIPSLPCDPVTKESYFYQTKSASPNSYRLYAILANNDDASIAKVGCQGGCGSDCLYNYGVSSMNIDLARCSYVCGPGGGREGVCQFFDDPTISLCPKLYYNDQNCNGECSNRDNRCKSDNGKKHQTP